MTELIHTATTRRQDRLSLPLRYLIELLQGWQAWRHARTTRQALERLDDRMLRDIGVERSEIAYRAELLARAPQAWDHLRWGR